MCLVGLVEDSSLLEVELQNGQVKHICQQCSNFQLGAMKITFFGVDFANEKYVLKYLKQKYVDSIMKEKKLL